MGGYGVGYGTWRRRVASGPAPFIGPLDGFEGQGYAILGPHRARTAYEGMCYRVRRSIDAGQEDIGFDSAGWVDKAWLLDAAGGGSLTIVADYDKAGLGHDGEQATTANQPRIVDTGVVDIGPNGHPCPVFDGSNDHYRVANSLAFSRNQAALTFAAVARRTGANSLNETQAFIQCTPASSTRVGFALWIATYALTVWGQHPDGAGTTTYNGMPTTLNAWQRYIGRARAADGAADTMVDGVLSTGAWGSPGSFSNTDQNGNVYIGTTAGGGAFKGPLGTIVLMQGARDMSALDAALAQMMP